LSLHLHETKSFLKGKFKREIQKEKKKIKELQIEQMTLNCL